MTEAWSLKGEMALSCSCTVFCPCVLSLGDHPPTEEPLPDLGRHPHRRRAISTMIDLAGIKVGMMMDLPGIMSRGNWTAALFVDDKASAQAVKGLTRIFTGRVGGTTHLLSILVGQFPRRAPGADQIRDARRDPHRSRSRNMSTAPSRRCAARRRARMSSSATANTGSAPDVIVARADKSRFRGFGRNWNLAGRSAEICQTRLGQCSK